MVETTNNIITAFICAFVLMCVYCVSVSTSRRPCHTHMWTTVPKCKSCLMWPHEQISNLQTHDALYVCVCSLFACIHMLSLSPHIVAVPGRWGSLSVPRLFRKGQRPGCSGPPTLQCPAHSQWHIQPLPGKEIHAGSECLFEINCV